MIVLPGPAAACFPGNETTFLLPILPPLHDGDIAAEVEILSEERVSPIEARVIKVVFGRYSSDRIIIARSSCDQTRIATGMRLVIAGRLFVRSNETILVPFDERLSPRLKIDEPATDPVQPYKPY